ncbi:hypothetical protein U1Q18_017351, partial [Sarracenia purpurea var. burkii]
NLSQARHCAEVLGAGTEAARGGANSLRLTHFGRSITDLDLWRSGDHSQRCIEARWCSGDWCGESPLELYMNHLVGPIPDELGGLKSLVSLDVYHNNLTGPIPPSLSTLSNLRFLRLNSNRLTGRIPRELTMLGNLKILDVSNNDLCGTIPTSGSFSKFTEE